VQIDSTSADNQSHHHLLRCRLPSTALHRPLPTERRKIHALAVRRNPSSQDLFLQDGGGRDSDVELRRKLRAVLRQWVGVQTRRPDDVSKTTREAAAARGQNVDGGSGQL